MPEKHLIVPAPPGSTPCAQPCHTDYYQEETESYGGSTVMQMMLGSQRVGLNPLPTQEDLYNDAVAHNRAGEPLGLWHIDPDGLRAALLSHRPPGFTNSFSMYAFDTIDEANAKIVHTIDTYEVAPAALCGEGVQWVAVVGYKTSAGGELISVFLNDPRPPITVGTGDPPDFEVSAANWSAGSYFTPVNAGGSFWQNKYTVVVDPAIPTGSIAIAREKPLADGKKLISPQQAIEFARRRLEERGSLARPLFANAVGQGAPAAPQLVRNLGSRNSYYYLVRYQIDGKEAAAVAIDARYGYFHEAIAFPKPVSMFRLSAKDALAAIRKSPRLPVSLLAARNRLLSYVSECRSVARAPSGALERELKYVSRGVELEPMSLDDATVHSSMVWQASPDASMSMLYPYWQIDSPGRHVYVRASDSFVLTEFLPWYWYKLGG